MSLQIQINGSTSPHKAHIGDTLTLTATGMGGITSYSWTLLDAPPGGDTISSPTSATATLNVNSFGSYLIKLTVNSGAASATSIAFVPTYHLDLSTQLSSPLRSPATGETIEYDATKGWNDTFRNLFNLSDYMYGGGTKYITCMIDSGATILGNEQVFSVSGVYSTPGGSFIPKVVPAKSDAGSPITAKNIYVYNQDNSGMSAGNAYVFVLHGWLKMPGNAGAANGSFLYASDSLAGSYNLSKGSGSAAPFARVVVPSTVTGPAVATGNIPQTFALSNGWQMNLQYFSVTGGGTTTLGPITFNSGSFVDITHATAAEVVSVLNTFFTANGSLFTASANGSNHIVITSNVNNNAFSLGNVTGTPISALGFTGQSFIPPQTPLYVLFDGISGAIAQQAISDSSGGGGGGPAGGIYFAGDGSYVGIFGVITACSKTATGTYQLTLTSFNPNFVIGAFLNMTTGGWTWDVGTINGSSVTSLTIHTYKNGTITDIEGGGLMRFVVS